MPKYNFSSNVKDTEKENRTSSGFMKLQQGDNKVRFMSGTAVYPKHFISGGYKGICVGTDNNCEGCAAGDKPNAKYMAWVIDRRDSQLKLLEVSYGVIRSIAVMQEDSDWAFDSVPMPYDINIKKDENAPPRGYYTVIGSPKRSEVTEAELKEVAAQTPIEEVVEKMKEKKIKNSMTPSAASSSSYPQEDINPNDLPF